MADIASQLKSIQERITKLAELAGPERAEAARELATEITAELERVIEQTTGGRAAPTRAAKARAPRDTVTRCPRCALRGFTFQSGSARETEEGSGRFEGLYRCASCGHEGWQRF